MEGISFIQQSKIPNLKGRIDYISNPEWQENLCATYSTADGSYWRDLAKENREDFKRKLIGIPLSYIARITSYISFSSGVIVMPAPP